jgi:hypothetical protein
MEQLPDINKVPETSTFSVQTFEHAQRVAKMLATSSLIPKEYQGNIQNTMIALEMANRIGASPLMVMQNLYIVHGKPSWSSSFIIAALNSCNRFSPLRFEMSGEGDTRACYAWAYEKSTEEKIEGPTVTMKMAKAEGWLDKNGSKWKTMPELMLRYRSAAFFGRLYAPEIMMGMQTQEEVIDITTQEVDQEEVRKNKEAERIALMISDATTVEQLQALETYVQDGQMELFNDKMLQLKAQ